MNIRIDCTIEGHEGEFVEYKPLRLKDRRKFTNSVGEEGIWDAVRSCLVRWKITDADGKEVPDITPDLKLDQLGELEDPMYSWVIGSFTECIIEGRRRAQSVPSSEPSP
jgi:hypothetical protein